MSATARLDLRLDTQDKDKITHAADLRGVPLATFVRMAALREAAAVAAEASTATLSPAETNLSAQLRGRATARLSTDEIMQLTRNA